MRVFSILICPLMVLFLMSHILFCQEAGSTPGQVNIIAHYQERLDDRILATGNVEVHYKNIKLFADNHSLVDQLTHSQNQVEVKKLLSLKKKVKQSEKLIFIHILIFFERVFDHQ